MKKYHSVVLGGTFDRLHRGHKALLTKAFEVGDEVTIGLTTDSYVRNFKSQAPIRQLADKQISNLKYQTIKKLQKRIKLFCTRKNILIAWLNGEGWEGRYTIVPIDTVYGTTVDSSTPRLHEYNAIIVSKETRKGALEINRARQEKSLPELAIVEIPMVPAEDEHHVSSTRIRAGEIDAEGDLRLPKSMRQTLRKPVGTLISDEDASSEIVRDRGAQIVCVGDSTTSLFLTSGIRPWLSIIDFQVERKRYDWDKKTFEVLRENVEVDYIKSGPGSISREAMRVIEKWGKQVSCHVLPVTYRVCIVDGEEDLLVLPVLLYAPLGTLVYYGQPAVAMSDSELLAGQPSLNRNIVNAGLPRRRRDLPRLAFVHRREAGIVRIVVTEEKKQLAEKLLGKFTHL